jgi:hypothetical protein
MKTILIAWSTESPGNKTGLAPAHLIPRKSDLVALVSSLLALPATEIWRELPGIVKCLAHIWAQLEGNYLD